MRLVAALSTLLVAASSMAAAQEAQLDASLLNGEKGGVLELKGTTEGLPDGTKIHVTLNVKDLAVNASYFMTIIKENRFAARKGFRGKPFAPLAYELKVELDLKAQRKAVRDLIRRSWGLPSGAKVLLASKVLECGTLEEQTRFREQTIKDLLEFVLKSQGKITAVRQKFNAPPPEDKKAHTKELIDFSRELKADLAQPWNTYKNKFVVLPEIAAVRVLNETMRSLGRSIQDLARDKREEGVNRLKQAADDLNRTYDELESRLPKKRPQRPKRPSPDNSK